MASKDPRVQTEQYLRQHKIKELLQLLVSELLFQKPADPKKFIVAYLEKAKVAGTKPLFTKQDLYTMFDMFDITRKGVVTQQQASNALTSMLGSKPQEETQTEEGEEQPEEQPVEPPFTQGQFVDYVCSEVVQATPLCSTGMLD